GVTPHAGARVRGACECSGEGGGRRHKRTRSSERTMNLYYAGSRHEDTHFDHIGFGGARRCGARATGETARPGVHGHADSSRGEVARPRPRASASARGDTGRNTRRSTVRRDGTLRWQGSFEMAPGRQGCRGGQEGGGEMASEERLLRSRP